MCGSWVMKIWELANEVYQWNSVNLTPRFAPFWLLTLWLPSDASPSTDCGAQPSKLPAHTRCRNSLLLVRLQIHMHEFQHTYFSYWFDNKVSKLCFNVFRGFSWFSGQIFVIFVGFSDFTEIMACHKQSLFYLRAQEESGTFLIISKS